MRLIKIDAKKQEVYEVECEGSLGDLQRGADCDCITSAGCLPNGDTLYVDDEGLLKNPERFFFNSDFYPEPLAGSGIVAGSDKEGNTVGAKSTLEIIRSKTVFAKDFI